MPRKDPLVTDLISGSIISGLFLPFVPGLLYDAGFKSPVQFAWILLAQKLLLSVSKETADAAARAQLVGLVASVVVVGNVTFSKHPSELAFVVLALFYWASKMFFPAKRSSPQKIVLKIGKEEFDLVQTILTFGTPLLASVVYLIGGRMALGIATIAVMIYNAQEFVPLSDVSKFQGMVKDLNQEQAFAITCWIVRKALVEGLTPIFFPGYYLLTFGVETQYLGFLYAAMMLTVKLRMILFDMVPELESKLKEQIFVFIGLSGVVVLLDMLFSTSLTVHLCLTYPLLAFLKYANQQQMKEFEKHAEWSKWIEIPSEILGCCTAAIFYYIFPLTRGMALNGFGCAAAFALFIPQVRDQVSSALTEIVKKSKAILPPQTAPGAVNNSPPPLPPKPKSQ
jgi:uncharacterized membrane protein YuzA (DUF378 family)